MKKNIFFIIKSILLLLPLLIMFSCQKFLNEKPGKSLVVPESLDDLQALLDMHSFMVITNPDILELLADNYYTTTAYWESAQDEERLSYVWDGSRAFLNTWQYAYQYSVYYSNVVLDVLSTLQINEVEKTRFGEIKGSALFYRANTFQQLAQLYCRPYSETSNKDLGISIRLTAAIEVKSSRSTVKETYDQIINDLKLALEILPDKSLFPTRPTKAAALGLLARTYLSMRDYENAAKYADLYLKIHPELMDYNEITNINKPFKRFNIETVYYSNSMGRFSLIDAPRVRIDSNLYRSYHQDDLRKQVFFKENAGLNAGTYQFNGNYDSELSPGRPFIGGIATNEIYLIRAECYARLGKTDLAIQDLNVLMKNRWKDDSWNPFTVTEEALSIILIERRKELLFRGLRWSDLRRYNLEGANLSLRRIIGGKEFELPPNDSRWVLLIPDEVINRSDIKQN